MNKRIVRILALVLCAVMVLGMIPMIVNASEIQPRKVSQNQYGEYTFETFEDLKELAAGTYMGWTAASYVGEGALVIEESLTLPSNLHIGNAQELVVPAGVVFNANDLYVDSMDVQGQVNCDYGSVAYDLKVSGKLIVEEYMTVGPDFEITGVENITFLADWGHICCLLEVYSEEAFLNALERAENAPAYLSYEIILSDSIELSQSATIPADTAVDISKPVTISAGATLTNYGQVYVYDPLTVAGELNNQGWVYIPYEESGRLDLTAGGQVVGVGSLMIWYNTPLDNVQDAVPGLDLSGYEIWDEGDGYIELYPAGQQGPGSQDRNTFKTFEELKALAADSYDIGTDFYYEGDGALVIEESLTLPSNMTIYAWNYDLIVPEGVVFNVNDIYFGSMDIQGQVNCSYGSAESALKVSGQLNVEDSFGISPDTQITGMENIHFLYDWGQFMCHTSVDSDAGLINALQAAADAPDYLTYYINVTGKIKLSQSVTVPADTSLDIYAPMTIPAGVTLTNYGRIFIDQPLYVAGELNNQSVDDYAIRVWYAEGGQLDLTAGGQFTGNQCLSVEYSAGELMDVQDAVPGLDLSQYDVQDEGGYIWLRSMSDLTRLATPTELKWGYQVDWDYDYVTDTTTTYVEPGVPGLACWRVNQPEQGQVAIDYYRVEDGGDVWVGGTNWHFNATELVEYRSVDNFLLVSPESGDYYFTLVNQGDYTMYADSETAISEIWTYVKPDAQLDPITNLQFDAKDFSVTWDAPSQADSVYCYNEEWFYSETESGEPRSIGYSWGWNSTESNLSNWDLNSSGTGYYYFRVRAISNDITKICNSEWTDLTLAFHVTELPNDVTEDFDKIVFGSDLPAEEKAELLQNLDTEALRDTMLRHDYVVDEIAMLEEELGGPAEVAVSDAVADFDASQISVIGANLNNVGEDVTLVLDKPEKEHVIPAQYHNSVAVSFSMDLENVENTEELAIPVEITLPVPANINPDFLVILHYHNDGSMEEVWPTLSLKNNQWYASFILTSFSDFIMTQYNFEVRGDMNGDGIVNDADVAHLLWHTLFPDMYEISGNADINGDGDVNDADVAYLLWHTLFPEAYPIS